MENVVWAILFVTALSTSQRALNIIIIYSDTAQMHASILACSCVLSDYTTLHMWIYIHIAATCFKCKTHTYLVRISVPRLKGFGGLGLLGCMVAAIRTARIATSQRQRGEKRENDAH